uniref:C40 family peptidase n=1 Tax=Roseihalotalea indica TaxID=2867963 RepID=A0AA49GUQ0_9BACT|nr:C40 family peptidase [Tunicatimonas sp. TK19036]
MINSLKLSIYLILFSLLIACSESGPSLSERSLRVIDSVKAEYAPDKRVAVFVIEPMEKNDTVVLRGETDQPQAKRQLLTLLDESGITYQDSIFTLPDPALGADTLGVVSISVANIRSQPRHSGELATQATMGTPLRILKKEGDWHLVQTPDKYISWMQGSFQPMSIDTFQHWQETEKIIYTNPYGFAYLDENMEETVSDLVMGNVLETKGKNRRVYWVRLPDGREAYVKQGEAVPLQDWITETEASEESLVATAYQLMGVPYLWGGTSSKGVDCSGYTKTIYFMNGKVLPRDASQQVHAGELVDESRNFDKLRPGDLLFFGRPATDSTSERIVHVGMWIGNEEFIHSPGLEAHVRVSSINPESANYDEYNLNRYIRTKRMLASNRDILSLKDVKLF